MTGAKKIILINYFGFTIYIFNTFLWLMFFNFYHTCLMKTNNNKN